MTVHWLLLETCSQQLHKHRQMVHLGARKGRSFVHAHNYLKTKLNQLPVVTVYSTFKV